MKHTTLTILFTATLLVQGCADVEPTSDGWDVSEFNEPTEELQDPDPNPDIDPDPDVDPCQDCVDPDPDTDPPILQPQLRAVFVAGHLGNYLDCPEQGYAEGANGVAPEQPGDGLEACADEDASCGFLNCEGAQLTLQIENVGELDARNVRITRLELFNVDDEWITDLPLLAVYDTDNAEVIETLDLLVGQSKLLRAEYQGPADPWSLLSGADSRGGNSGILRITIEADDIEPLIVESTELYTLPAIST